MIDTGLGLFLGVLSVLSNVFRVAGIPMLCVQRAVSYGTQYTVLFASMYRVGFSEGIWR